LLLTRPRWWLGGRGFSRESGLYLTAGPGIRAPAGLTRYLLALEFTG
jgi:hypothetical protein